MRQWAALNFAAVRGDAYTLDTWPYDELTAKQQTELDEELARTEHRPASGVLVVLLVFWLVPSILAGLQHSFPVC